MRRPLPHLSILSLGLLLALTGCATTGMDDGGDASPNVDSTESMTRDAMDGDAMNAVDLDGLSPAIELPISSDPTVSFAIWFEVGSADDPPGKEGLAALTGSLLSDGATRENSVDSILEQLYPLASSYSARVDKQMTVLSGRTHRDTVDTFFDLFTDAYLEPAFSAEDFERLRSNQLSFLETTLRFASEEELAKAALTHAAFDGTSYAHPVQGTVESLKSLTVDDVREFYRTHYTRERAHVALGGGYSPDLVDTFRATLAELPAGAGAERPMVEPAEFDGRDVLLVEKEGPNTSISFGFPIDVGRGERDFYALWIANSWLGEHRNSSSHLYKVIRETRGLNYGDYSYIEAFPEGGQRSMPPVNVARDHQLFEVWIRTLPNEQALFATRAALREIQALIDDGMSQEDFELTRDFLLKYSLHYAETTRERLGYAIDDVFYGIDGEGHLARFAEVLPTITRDEVNAAVRRHLQLDDLKIAMVTGDIAGLSAAMANDTPTPIEYASPKPPEVLAEDEEIVRVPFSIEASDITVVPVAEIFQSGR